MTKQIAAVPFLTLMLDSSSPIPLHRQLYDGLRHAILSGQLDMGTQLPSTRTLARELGISRTTVVTAFEQLLADGYLEARVGDGTYVARVLPEDLLSVRTRSTQMVQQAPKVPLLSQRGTVLANTPVTATPRVEQPGAFRPGLPALDEVPFDIWERLACRYYRHPPRGLFAYGDSAGYRPLREAIAAYLSTSRAVHCTATQVIIVSGSQQALDITARMLLDPNDAVWLEDPGYIGVRGALIGAGATVIPVPVDEEGLIVTAGEARCANAHMAYVTPSHQYPLGVVMSLKRRLALLEWADRAGARVLEDDYDSEYRYRGRPLASLQGLDTKGQVIYMGTFSKVLFPALRLGYLVVPPDLADAFSTARALADRHSPPLEQAVLADFITEGHFVRHIRRMRALYAQRQQVLLEAVQHELAGILEAAPQESGMHLIGWLPPDVDDKAVAQHAVMVGVEALPLSAFRLQTAQRPGLLLGYVGFNEDEIREGVRRLALVLERVMN